LGTFQHLSCRTLFRSSTLDWASCLVRRPDTAAGDALLATPADYRATCQHVMLTWQPLVWRRRFAHRDVRLQWRGPGPTSSPSLGGRPTPNTGLPRVILHRYGPHRQGTQWAQERSGAPVRPIPLAGSSAQLAVDRGPDGGGLGVFRCRGPPWA